MVSRALGIVALKDVPRNVDVDTGAAAPNVDCALRSASTLEGKQPRRRDLRIDAERERCDLRSDGAVTGQRGLWTARTSLDARDLQIAEVETRGVQVLRVRRRWNWRRRAPAQVNRQLRLRAKKKYFREGEQEGEGGIWEDRETSGEQGQEGSFFGRVHLHQQPRGGI